MEFFDGWQIVIYDKQWPIFASEYMNVKPSSSTIVLRCLTWKLISELLILIYYINNFADNELWLTKQTPIHVYILSTCMPDFTSKYMHIWHEEVYIVYHGVILICDHYVLINLSISIGPE